MPDTNISSVSVTLRGVDGRPINESVGFKFYNQRAGSLNRLVPATAKVWNAVLLDGIPAFPFGLYEVFIDPAKHRFKKIFLSVQADGSSKIDEPFFFDPSKVQPVFSTFADLQTGVRWKELWRVLQTSGRGTEAEWNKLGNQEKAGMFNLYAKMTREKVADDQPVFRSVSKIDEFKPARVLARVSTGLFDAVGANHKTFHSVSGALHEFPPGWQPAAEDNSFKTFDAAGNLQLTFAKNPAGEFLADIDIDDHQGIQHAGDVLKHTITGKDTHPYDIHEILIFFQGLDPGYQLV